jgi:hypothetical protein
MFVEEREQVLVGWRGATFDPKQVFPKHEQPIKANATDSGSTVPSDEGCGLPGLLDAAPACHVHVSHAFSWHGEVRCSWTWRFLLGSENLYILGTPIPNLSC